MPSDGSAHTDELTCQEVVELVTDYLEGRLEVRERLLFEEHIAFCDWCVAYLAQFRETIRLTGAIREDDIPPAVREGLLRVFRDWRRVG
jgi:anti-sigma factor RsiW